MDAGRGDPRPPVADQGEANDLSPTGDAGDRRILGGWLVLGALLVTFGAVEAPGIMPAGLGPLALGAWLAGLPLLGWHRWRAAVTRAWLGALATRRGRTGALVFIVLAVVLADLIGMYGALAAIAALGTIAVALALVAGPARLASVLATASLVVVSLGAGLGAAEALVRRPEIARRLGTPPELAAWEARYDRHWERNAFGFRSRHETMARAPGTLRVLALGDSFTWGDRIPSSENTWPAALERRLTPLVAGRRVEVLNLGRNGFTTANEAELLRRVGWQFDPDVVIVQFFRNDVLPSGPDFARATSSYVWPRHTIVPASLRGHRLGSSVLLDLFEDAYTAWRNRSKTDPWHDLYRDDFVGWQQLAGALQEMGDSARVRAVPIYLLIYPALAPGPWTAATHPDRGMHERVIGVAREAGLRVVDLTSTFGDGVTDGRTWWAMPYDSHPNAAANEIVAGVLTDRVAADIVTCPSCGGEDAVH